MLVVTSTDPPPPPPPPSPGRGWSNQPPTGQPQFGPPHVQTQYGQPAYGYGQRLVDHPQGTTILVLGILSLVLCSFLGPFAWVMGNRVVREIDASRGMMGGRSSANAGRICGIIATVLLGLGLLALVLFFVFAIAAGTSSSMS